VKISPSRGQNQIFNKKMPVGAKLLPGPDGDKRVSPRKMTFLG
jgi:hypothetical protein